VPEAEEAQTLRARWITTACVELLCFAKIQGGWRIYRV